MTIISSLSLSMSNHLKKSCFDYFLLDDSPSRMVKVKESSFPFPKSLYDKSFDWQIPYAIKIPKTTDA